SPLYPDSTLFRSQMARESGGAWQPQQRFDARLPLGVGQTDESRAHRSAAHRKVDRVRDVAGVTRIAGFLVSVVGGRGGTLFVHGLARFGGGPGIIRIAFLGNLPGLFVVAGVAFLRIRRRGPIEVGIDDTAARRRESGEERSDSEEPNISRTRKQHFYDLSFQ